MSRNYVVQKWAVGDAVIEVRAEGPTPLQSGTLRLLAALSSMVEDEAKTSRRSAPLPGAAEAGLAKARDHLSKARAET